MGNEFSYENLVRVIGIWSGDWLEPYEEEDSHAMESASESDILNFLCGR